MTTNDELLARADSRRHMAECRTQDRLLIVDLAAALRAALEFVAAHDAVEHLIADHTDDRDAYNAAVERFDRARQALAADSGETTPTEDDE